VCNIDGLVDGGLSDNLDKLCEIEDNVGCDRKGRSVHQKLDKIKKQSVKNNKGIKKIYDQCKENEATCEVCE
jgi:hypothetical protein